MARDIDDVTLVDAGNEARATLRTLQASASLWSRWGLTYLLLLIAVAAAAAGIVAKMQVLSGWDDASLAASLGFAAVAVILAVVTRIDANRRAAHREAQGVRLVELEIGRRSPDAEQRGAVGPGATR